VLEPVEARLTMIAGVLLLVLAAGFALFPRVLAYPLLIVFAWLGVGLLYRSWKLRRKGRHRENCDREEDIDSGTRS
jgi:cardiolipin synthase